MSQKIYRNVLRDAWSVTWRHPALWILGAFALFMGQSQFFYSLAGLLKITTWGSEIATLAATTQRWYIPVFSPNSWMQVAAGFGIAALIFLALVLIMFMVIQSQGAIMTAGDFIFRKRMFSFQAAWHTAFNHFWGILGVLAVKIIAATVIALGVAAIHYPLDTYEYAVWPKLLFVLGFVLLALVDILVTFTALYATCYVVLENQKIIAAYKSAINLFARHWLASLEVGVFFLVANVVAIWIAKAVFSYLFVPLFYFAVLMKAGTGMLTPVILLNLSVITFGVWLVFAIYTTWFFMAIVVLFDHMNSDAPVSKVIRFLQSLVARD